MNGQGSHSLLILIRVGICNLETEWVLEQGLAWDYLPVPLQLHHCHLIHPVTEIVCTEGNDSNTPGMVSFGI